MDTLYKGDNDDDNNNSHIGHCTHTAESASIEVQNIFHGRNNITCSTDCKYRVIQNDCRGQVGY
jgi:hypothetical protein